MIFQKQTMVGRVISQVCVILALALSTIPLFLIVMRSLNGGGLHNYLRVIDETPFFLFVRNSAFVSITIVAIVLVSSIGAAFVLDVIRPRGSAFMAVAILAGLALPSIAIIVPVFTLMNTFGLINTFWAVIIPLSAISIPFGVLLVGDHMRGLPGELYEAAKLDGASSLQILLRVLLPLSWQILAVVAVFTFLTAWNEYLLPLVFLQDLDLQLAAQIPTYFQGDRQVIVPMVFAANILISIPVVILYILLQGQFRKGLAGGAIK